MYFVILISWQIVQFCLYTFFNKMYFYKIIFFLFLLQIKNLPFFIEIIKKLNNLLIFYKVLEKLYNCIKCIFYYVPILIFIILEIF